MSSSMVFVLLLAVVATGSAQRNTSAPNAPFPTSAPGGSFGCVPGSGGVPGGGGIPGGGGYGCCYPYDYYGCYTSTSTYPPPGQASASANSNGNNPSGNLSLSNAAVAGYNNQDPKGGFGGNATSQNNAAGISASVSSNVAASSTNTNQTNPVVTANSNGGSYVQAASGTVDSLDQAVSSGNSSAVSAKAQSQVLGNGTAVNGNSNTNANAVQRSGKKNPKLVVGAGQRSAGEKRKKTTPSQKKRVLAKVRSGNPSGRSGRKQRT